MMPMSGQLPEAHRPAPCKSCRGTRGQHWPAPDGCQCARCDREPERCLSYEPDFDARPEKRASGRRTGLASKKDSKMQKAGAVKVIPALGTRRREALDVIRAAESHGRTFEEITSTIGRDYSQVGPRVRELVADGWVVDSGRTRKSRHGADQVVWIASGFATLDCPPDHGIVRSEPTEG